MAGTIISDVIVVIVATIMFGIGITQLKSKEPVGLSTGEKPLKKEQLSDVNSWNKKHGIMWIIYGFCIIAAWICSSFIKNNLYAVIPSAAGIFVPLPIMILYHHKLVKKYIVK